MLLVDGDAWFGVSDIQNYIYISKLSECQCVNKESDGYLFTELRFVV